MKSLTQHPATWSNIVFIAPIITAFYYELTYLGVTGLIGIAVSSLYHYYDEKKFYFADHFISLVLLIWSVWLVYRGGFEPQSLLYALLAFVVLSTYFFVTDDKGKNEIRHGYWHLFISVVGILSIFIYAL